jgi:phosphoglycerate dehydrogenase-like enzyme
LLSAHQAPLRVLILSSASQVVGFRYDPPHVETALAAYRHALPPLDFDFCEVGAPQLPEKLKDAYAVFGYRIPTGDIGAAKALRLVQMTGAGIEHILPLDWLPRQVALANASGVHAAKITEWAGMVFLMLHSHMPHFATAQRAHDWSKRYSSLIAGKRALIYGTGGLGSAVATAARRLGIAAIGVRRAPAPVRGFDQVIGMAEAQEALGTADFAVLTTPLTPETRHLANAAFFAGMKPGAGFANFGRGGLVDQPALTDALTRAVIGGAIIDVTEPEPPPADSPLWDTPNLVITPHISCDDPETYVASTLNLLLDNVARRAAGRPVRNRIARARAY